MGGLHEFVNMEAERERLASASAERPPDCVGDSAVPEADAHSATLIREFGHYDASEHMGAARKVTTASGSTSASSTTTVVQKIGLKHRELKRRNRGASVKVRRNLDDAMDSVAQVGEDDDEERIPERGAVPVAQHMAPQQAPAAAPPQVDEFRPRIDKMLDSKIRHLSAGFGLALNTLENKLAAPGGAGGERG